ncbi:MAG: Lacal_2735 family protein [Saprospiraceae bacterium]|nr:Lacal_2735 family protein [Saprospiraceae bacterium]
MFGLFKKKSEREKLQEQYKNLTEEAFRLSKTDRKASDQKTAEANEILQKMDSLTD